MAEETIIVAGNGPSAQDEQVGAWAESEARVFRTNHFYLPDSDRLNYRVDDWFICEDVWHCRMVKAWLRGGGYRPRLWMPGLNMAWCENAQCRHLAGESIQIQKRFAQLPIRCRWEYDLMPERPLMGSYALAVAVGMRPKVIMICGQDLFMHKSNASHGGLDFDTRAWQQSFNQQYIANEHRNHTLRGDLKYIGAALADFKGHVICVGSVMKEYFEKKFPQWEWQEG